MWLDLLPVAFGLQFLVMELDSIRCEAPPNLRPWLWAGKWKWLRKGCCPKHRNLSTAVEKKVLEAARCCKSKTHLNNWSSKFPQNTLGPLRRLKNWRFDTNSNTSLRSIRLHLITQVWTQISNGLKQTITYLTLYFCACESFVFSCLLAKNIMTTEEETCCIERNVHRLVIALCNMTLSQL